MAARKKKAAKKAKRKTKRKATKKKARKKLEPKTRGRPKIKIDWKEFDKLCVLGCLLEEIASWFDCSVDTIERRVEEEHGILFAEYFRQKQGKGNVALRRAQMQMALKGDRTMLVWLGKNRLGQKDRSDVTSGGRPMETAQVVIFPSNGREVEEPEED